MRLGLATSMLVAGGMLAGVIASCGKDPSGAAAPRAGITEAGGEVTQPDGAEVGVGGSAGTSDTGGEDPSIPRLELEAEFHRTRLGAGSGLGFWVLGIVHNPHTERVTDVRPSVQLLDEAETLLARADGRIRRSLGPGERASVAVLVAEPVAHDHLRLVATAIVDEGPEPEPLTLRLVHDPPERADFGGWFVIGQVQNTGLTPVEGARVEIQGVDRSGKLLGIDWVEIDPVEPGRAIEFDVGDLRYEEPPSRFLVELRGPALE